MRHFDVRWSIGAMHWWYYSTVIQIHSTCRCSSNFQKNLIILKHFSRELSWPKLKWLFSINKKHTSTITAINVLFLETNSQKTYLMYFKNSPFFFSPRSAIPPILIGIGPMQQQQQQQLGSAQPVRSLPLYLPRALSLPLYLSIV